MDIPVLVYTALAVLGTTLLIGVVPALRSTRGGAMSALSRASTAQP